MAAKKVTLTEAIEMGGEKLVELSFRKPTAGDLRKFPALASAQTMGHIIDLASALTGQPVAMLERMSLKDLEQVAEVINSF